MAGHTDDNRAGALRAAVGSTMADLKYAARMLSRQPGFSLAVALTLALGLGVNATVLGMVDALLLRPFQFPGYERLIVLWEAPSGTAERQSVAPANYLEWRRQASTVQDLVAWEGWGATLGGRADTERVQAFRVSPGYFEVVGVPPATGRAFTASEEQPGRDHTVVLGDGLWKRRFGGDPRVVGSEILLDGEPYTVVGIAPPGFDFPVAAELWAPLAFTPTRATDRLGRTLTVLGRLAPGRSLADAQAEMDIVCRRLAQQFPDTNRDRRVSVRTLSNAFREDNSGAFVGILQLGAGLVLLIACANLAGLLLARANDRRREVAVRTALGAGRMRIARQLVTETVLLGLVASGLALILARIGLDALRSAIPADMAQHIEGWNNIRLDHRLFIAVPLLAIGLGLLVGLIPATAGRRTPLTAALKDGYAGAGVGRNRQRIRQALVVGEIALALVLLVTAGLSFGAAARMASQPGGFDAQRLLTFEIPLPEARYTDDRLRRALADNLIARMQEIPGVRDAALANILPAAGWSPTTPIVTEEDPDPDPARRRQAGLRAVAPQYFSALRVPLRSGRAFSSADREDAQPVVIVSATLSARLWPGRDPLGRRLRIGDAPGTWATVVGVAGDVAMYNWWDGVDHAAVYVPLRQAPPGALSAAVRTHGDPAAVTSAVRAAVGFVDPLLAVHRPRTMEQAIRESTFGLTFLGSLMGICGALALLLSSIGVYSMMAYAVSQRAHEFGVRLAIGATAQDIVRLSLRQAGVLTALGLVIGLASAAVLGRLMSSAFYGIIALEPAPFAAVALVLAIVSFGAAYLPARRTLRLDPATVLRAQ